MLKPTKTIYLKLSPLECEYAWKAFKSKMMYYKRLPRYNDSRSYDSEVATYEDLLERIIEELTNDQTN